MIKKNQSRKKQSRTRLKKVSRKVSRKKKSKRVKKQEVQKVQEPLLPKSRRLTKLSGPSSFYFNHFPQLDDLRVLILGEAHVLDRICQPQGTVDYIEVHIWLEDLCWSAPATMDYFIEDYHEVETNTQERKKEENEMEETNRSMAFYGTAPLHAVRARFQKVRENPRYYHRLRYHPIDIRQCNTEKCYYNRLLRFAEQITNEKIDFCGFTNEQLDEMLDYYLGFNMNGKVAFESYLQYAYYKMWNLNIGDWYLTFLMSDVNRVHQMLSPYPLAFLRGFAHEYIRLGRISHLLCMVSLSQDFYALAHLILNKAIHYAIVYVGDAHALFMKYVLQRLYPDCIPSIDILADANYNQCLTLPKPFDFFA